MSKSLTSIQPIDGVWYSFEMSTGSSNGRASKPVKRIITGEYTYQWVKCPWAEMPLTLIYSDVWAKHYKLIERNGRYYVRKAEN